MIHGQTDSKELVQLVCQGEGTRVQGYDSTTARQYDSTSVRVYDRTKVRWDEKMSRLSFRQACEGEI